MILYFMANSLTIETIKKVLPAVVSIVVARNLEEIEKQIPFWLLPYLAPYIPKDEVDLKGNVKIGGGSGFIFDKSGLVLTNRHVVIDKDAEYTAVLSTGEKYGAKIMALDEANDVAVLKINLTKQDFPVVLLGDSSGLELGQTVIAIGNALGLFRNSVSRGIVSGLARSISAFADIGIASAKELCGLIQTDAAINPGNSGGPLVNLRGEAIGINSAVVFGAENIGFAIPINVAKKDLNDLKNYGRLRRPILGIQYVAIDERLQNKLKLPVDYGVLIVKNPKTNKAVMPNSPAEEAGILENDVILECNNRKITRERPLQEIIQGLNVGDEIQLVVLRSNQRIEVKMKLAEQHFLN